MRSLSAAAAAFHWVSAPRGSVLLAHQSMRTACQNVSFNTFMSPLDAGIHPCWGTAHPVAANRCRS